LIWINLPRSSSQVGISTDGIALLGRWGMMVPAVTINPPVNLLRAKSLASASVANVLVIVVLTTCHLAALQK
jgi:hypothetical protein